MSAPEVILWARLEQLRARGFPVRRQFPFQGYYLDFVCLPRRLVIEVDGSQHADEIQVEHDAVRDQILARKGFRVLCFWAGAVRWDVDAVMDQVVLALEAAPARAEIANRPPPGLNHTPSP